jgi:hypothetical protein
MTGGAELEARHEDDVRKLGQGIDLRAIEQISLDAFDTLRGQALAQSLLAEPRDADDTLARCRGFGKLRECRADLSPNAENDEIAVDSRKLCHQFRRRRGHHIFKMCHIAKSIRQNSSRGHSVTLDLAARGSISNRRVASPQHWGVAG